MLGGLVQRFGCLDVWRIGISFERGHPIPMLVCIGSRPDAPPAYSRIHVCAFWSVTYWVRDDSESLGDCGWEWMLLHEAGESARIRGGGEVESTSP